MSHRRRHKQRHNASIRTTRLQGGLLSLHLTDFVDYEVPLRNTDYIGQYGVSPYHLVPGLFGASQGISAIRLRTLKLSVLPLAGETNPDAYTFTVRSAVPIAYTAVDVSTPANPAVTAAWEQQTTLVIPTTQPKFVDVGSWDFKSLPQGSIPQVVSDAAGDANAVLGLVHFQVLNIDSSTQYTATTRFNLQFRIDLEVDLPVPSLTKARTYFGQGRGSQFWRSFSPNAKVAESPVTIDPKAYRKISSCAPSAHSYHRCLQINAMREEAAMEASFIVLPDELMADLPLETV